MSEKMELEILISMSEKNIKKVEESVKNLKRKTKKDRELELAINLAKVRTQYMELQAMIRKARKDGESEIAIRLQVEAEKMKLDLNEANRALRNLRNTGDETKSMLGKMFDNAGMSGFFSRFIGPAGIAGAVSGLFTLGQQVERTEIAFQQMTGSIEK